MQEACVWAKLQAGTSAPETWRSTVDENNRKNTDLGTNETDCFPLRFPSVSLLHSYKNRRVWSHAPNLRSHTRPGRSLPPEGIQPRVQGVAFSYSEGCRCFQLPLARHHQSGLIRLEISEAVLTGFSQITKSPYKNTPKIVKYNHEYKEEPLLQHRNATLQILVLQSLPLGDACPYPD